MPGGKSYLGLGGGSKARTEDIRLPNDTGRVDPRLQKPDVGGALGKAAGGLKMLRDRSATKRKPTSRRSPGGSRY